jgi:hypothetical protein
MEDSFKPTLPAERQVSVPAPLIPPELQAILGGMSEIAAALKGAAEINASADVQKARIASDAEIQKATMQSRILAVWMYSICGIICLLAVVGSLALFFGETRPTAEKIIVALFAFMAGYGARSVRG